MVDFCGNHVGEFFLDAGFFVRQHRFVPNFKLVRFACFHRAMGDAVLSNRFDVAVDILRTFGGFDQPQKAVHGGIFSVPILNFQPQRVEIFPELW